MKTLLLILITLTFAFGETLHVAVASSMRPPMEVIAELFTKKTGHKVLLSFGSSGSFYRQILGGAPYDVFVSADELYPRRLVNAGKAISESLTPFARGRLVLFSIKSSLSRGLASVEEGRRVAIANPRYAPYGRATVEVLRRKGLYDKVRTKLVYGSNVGQAFQFVVAGGADMGFVSLSLVKSYKEGSYVLIPEELHGPIVHVAVITMRGSSKKSARGFLEFLKSREAGEVLRRFGFGVP